MKFRKNSGFTIVELLIVIIVIAILATLVITAYNGVQTRARDAKTKSDIHELIKAINVARINTNQPLGLLTNDVGWYCADTTGNWPQANPNNLEPRDLPKSSDCWQKYYWALDQISAASGTNLDSLRAGDSRGNPYAIRGTEGRNDSNPCTPDKIWVFTGHNGDSFIYKTLSPFLTQCQ